MTHAAPSSQAVRGELRQGFVYERVPHVMLETIAHNAEIDVIWGNWQAVLEPLREELNATLDEQWGEWEIPREAGVAWPEAGKQLHGRWWQARIARQKEIDASIAAKAEFEYLYDKPYSDNRKVRVAGPFTVESLSPHRVLGVDEDGELIGGIAEHGPGYPSCPDDGRARVRCSSAAKCPVRCPAHGTGHWAACGARHVTGHGQSKRAGRG